MEQLKVLPDAISVPAAPAVFIDGFRDLTAVMLDRDGAPLYAPVPVWTTSDRDIATVSPTGRVAGGAPGRAFIRATVNGRTDSAIVTVLPAADPELMIIAHRGFRPLFPENTIEAIDSAFARGADGVELDVQATKDGVIILMHDDTVDRTTNGRGAVKDLTYAEIQKLNACVRFKGWPPCAVPTLSEALDAVKGRGFVILDLKPRFPSSELVAILANVRAAKLEHSVMYTAFDYAMLADLRRLDPIAPLGYLTVGIPKIEEMMALGRAAAMPDQKALRSNPAAAQAFIEAARINGVDVGTWTAATVSDIKALVALGVWRIVSDVPASKRDVLP